MEQLRLNDSEQRRYHELFNSCDSENNGKISGPKASELFVKSGLSHEILHQISELCGAKRLGYFGRSQFYVALKLIAAVQSGFPVVLESIGSGLDIPLPKFSRFESTEDGRRQQVLFNQPVYQQSQYQGALPQQQATVRAAPQQAPARSLSQQAPARPALHIKTNNRASSHQTSATEQSPVSPNSSEHTPTSPLAPIPPYGNSNNVSSNVHPVAPQSKSGAVRQQANPYGPQHHPQFKRNSSSGQANHVDKVWMSFEDESQALVRGAQRAQDERQDWTHFTDSSSKADTSSISSESESIEDVWSITSEQREYYINQFRSMQPNLAANISGPVAKEFFEKSRLPISELAKIWQLSDVNKDGALNLEEFCTAMHLVVLRRNDIDLPEQLPLSLLPHVPFNNTEEPFSADLPEGGATNTQSPQDARIIHPVPVRLSPESQLQTLETTPENDVAQDDSYLDLLVDVGRGGHPKYQSTPQHPRPRPTKSMSTPGPTHNLSTHVPAQQSSQDTQPHHQAREGEASHKGAPVPPPRTKSHSRSSSLDSKQMIDAAEHVSGPPVAPRKPKENAGVSEMSKSLIVTTPVSLEGKISQLPAAGGDQETKGAAKSSAFSQEKTELKAHIKAQKEKNLTLTRLHGELNQELQEVMEQRIALEIQLEHLRPYYGDYF